MRPEPSSPEISPCSRRRLLRMLTCTMAGTAVLSRLALAEDAVDPVGDPKPLLLEPGKGKTGSFGGVKIDFKLTAAQTRGNLGSAELVLAPASWEAARPTSTNISMRWFGFLRARLLSWSATRPTMYPQAVGTCGRAAWFTHSGILESLLRSPSKCTYPQDTKSTCRNWRRYSKMACLQATKSWQRWAKRMMSTSSSTNSPALWTSIK